MFMISCQNCFPNGQKCQNQFTTVIICFIIIVMWLCGIILRIGHLYLLQNSIRDISLLFLKRLSRRFPTCSERLFIPNSEHVFLFPTKIRKKTQFQYILKLGIKSSFWRFGIRNEKAVLNTWDTCLTAFWGIKRIRPVDYSVAFWSSYSTEHLWPVVSKKTAVKIS